MAVLVIGATRGLGAELAKQYADQGKPVYATSRSASPAKSHDLPASIKWLTGIDLMEKDVGDKVVDEVSRLSKVDIVIITAGYFGKEEPGSNDSPPDWDEEQRMYTTSSIAPVFIVTKLVSKDLLASNTKIVLVSSEAGSITLRHPTEGGGNYGHHASKAALNMVGKLLSIDLKPKGIIVSVIHPGFMRTEMTKSVGFDKYWDAGGAVTPDVAARSLIQWTESLTMEYSGQFWAPRGKRDIGTWNEVMAEKDVGDGPLQLPW